MGASLGVLELRGAGGEPVDLRRAIASHGLVRLPPFQPEDDRLALGVVLRDAAERPRAVRIAVAGGGAAAAVTVEGPRPGARDAAALLEGARTVLWLDADLSGFYTLAEADPELAWATAGAGRMIRSPTVFEDLIKTICTTNCAWSGTVRMVSALVEHLGEPCAHAPQRRAFPTPRALAEGDDAFYRDVVRAGYRGRYLRGVAAEVAEGRLDVEALADPALTDDEVAARLLALPGIGPYAAAHVLMLLGRHSRLVLDSWTRPTYAELVGRATVTDAAIARRFRRYGPWAGLAFWLFLTRGWVADEADGSASRARATTASATSGSGPKRPA